MKNGGLIILDIDEVVVDIGPKWIKLAMQDSILFNRIRNISAIKSFAKGEEDLRKTVMGRDIYDLSKWLCLSDLAKEHFMDIYRKNGRFYSDLSLTKFAFNLLSNPKSRHIIFLSHILNGDVDESKSLFIRDKFKKCSFEMHFVDIKDKKSDKIKEHGWNYDLYVEDLPLNMLDVMKNTAKDNGNFCFPVLGYNASIPILCEEVIKEKKLNLTSY
jgi:hypothetical protein